MSKRRRAYSPEFRRQMVELVRSGCNRKSCHGSLLLGAIPMEDMDLVIEPSRQKVQPGEPEHPLVVGQG